MTMPMQIPAVEQVVTNALKRIPRGDIARMNRMARLNGYPDYESLLRGEATKRVTQQTVEKLAAVQPGSYAGGGPLAGSPQLGGAGASLPGSSPAGGPLALPAAGGTNATQQMAAQKLASSAAGNPLPTRATQMLPEFAPSTVAANADNALLGGLASVNPGAYSAGGPLSLLSKTPGWNNGLATTAAQQPTMLDAAQFGPNVPSVATGAADRLSTAAAGTSGAAPIAGAAAPASVAPIAADVGSVASNAAGAAETLAPQASMAARLLGAGEGGVTSKLLLGRAGQIGAGLAVGGEAAKLADMINAGGHNSIADQFLTGAAGGGVAGAIGGIGTGPGALVTGLAGAAIGGVGNVLGNQLGWWGEKHNKGVNVNKVDLAVSQLMNQAEKYGVSGDQQQQMVQALRANSDLYAQQGGAKQLGADMTNLMNQLPGLAQQQVQDRARMAYDNKFRDQALQAMQPKIDMMQRQYGMLADLYEQRGDPTFAAALRANATQQALEMQQQITMIPQQVALENARAFAAQLNQARTSQQIGQIVNPKGATAGGGLLSIAQNG